ncbi:hypothetical protein H0H92_015771 [Tricholoma furcatifolium]|nr:hypothetical protein H0H92_015771 [Tricholoma furcatifolium]
MRFPRSAQLDLLGIIQSFLFSIDSNYNSMLSSITTVAEIPAKNLTYLEGSPGNWHLLMCNDIPHGQKIYPCMDIFRTSADTGNDLAARALNNTGRSVSISAVHDSSTKDITGVTLSSGSKTFLLDLQCTQNLVYSEQIMHNSKREDLTFVLLQFWLFAISVIAIMKDSVPHTLAVLATRILITFWSAYALWRTKYIETQFTQMIFQSGTPCSLNVFPAYFGTRISYEDYNNQSLKCVGAPQHINRIHKFFMAVLACLQLECFILVAAGSLWIDVLVNTAIEGISAHTVLYKGLFTATTIGWYAIRREMRKLMVTFLGIAFFLLLGWSLMFYSIVYRWTFLQWPYLGCFTVASLILIVASIVLGVICRLNFGKGLAQYLHAEAALASSNFAPEVFKHDEEKGPLDMPDVKPLPTAADAFYVAPLVPKEPGVLQRSQVAHIYQVPYNVPF